jgi:ankyrin repeat protein
MHIAALQGYGEVVKLLASQGADLNVRNAKGLTPLGSVATRAGRKSMVDLLRSLGASE